MRQLKTVQSNRHVANTWKGQMVGALLLGLLAIGFVGCGGSESSSADSGPGAIVVSPDDPVDFSEVAQAFENAAPSIKFSVSEILSVVRSGAYADARTQLLKIAQAPALTPEQKKALEDLAAKLEKLPPRKP